MAWGICTWNEQEMHEFVLVAWYAFVKNRNKVLLYLVYLKPSGDILLIWIAIKFVFQHLFVPYYFQSEAASPPISSPASKEVNTSTSSKYQPGPGSSDTLETYKRPHKTFSSLYHSKFRHLTGSALHRSQYIENVRNINTSIFGECDGFQSNSKRAAIPLEGPGGKIAVIEVCLLFLHLII